MSGDTPPIHSLVMATLQAMAALTRAADAETALLQARDLPGALALTPAKDAAAEQVARSVHTLLTRKAELARLQESEKAALRAVEARMHQACEDNLAALKTAETIAGRLAEAIAGAWRRALQSREAGQAGYGQSGAVSGGTGGQGLALDRSL